MTTQITQHWDNYYNQNKDFGLISSQTISRFLDLTHPRLPKTCLDIGCGTGQLTRELYHRGYRCHGVDISSKAIDLARSHTIHSDQLTYQQFDFELSNPKDLPLQNYTLITCKLVYAFIKNKSAFLYKVSRLLSNSGVFVIITPVSKESDKREIAVDYSQTLAELQTVFKTVSTFNGLNVTYFICQNA